MEIFHTEFHPNRSKYCRKRNSFTPQSTV